MIFTLIIRTPATEPERWQKAQRFIDVAVDGGHTIRQVFFHSAGVLSAMHHDALPGWHMLAERSGGAVEEHGIDIAPPFFVGGLGALIEAAVKADKVLSFV